MNSDGCMARAISASMVLFLLFSIPVLFILGKATELTLIDRSLDIFAGLLSLALGTFTFIQVKILSKKPQFKRTVFEILLVLGGLIILIPQAYTYLEEMNAFIDSIIVVGYLLLLLMTAYFTKNSASEDLSTDPRFQKMMK